ncbi:MAG: chemotaxis protein CheB, partial [Ginsengibacter sp.]
MQSTNKKTSTEVSKNLFPVVGIGASAGGLDAFKKLIQSIPEKSGMAYIIVQHLHPEYDSALPEILQRETKIPVVEIIDKVHVEPDFIYVIPSNKMLTASDGILHLGSRTDKKKNNLAIDVFFSSLAEVHGAQSIGVILSGTGTDGTAGLENIKNYGGITFAQDAETAAYNAMPQSAIDAGIVDFVLSPEKIVTKLVELQQTYNNLSLVNSTEADKINEEGFRRVLAMIRMRLGVDFNFYKQSTIRRRIIRRIAILKLNTIEDYQKHLKKDATELDLLFQDLLIQVTSFFRDPEAYDVLCNKILPEIIKIKSNDNVLRIWVPGCASGQEAYSIAICLNDFLSNYPIPVKVKIFGTDISEKAIAKARNGVYSKAEIEGVSDSRLKEFFNKTDGHYQLTKQIRDMCIFAVHNFLKDPPFAKMNLISCRNVLIYLEPFLQKKSFTLFHYALMEKGFLLLGKSESVGIMSELFNDFDKKNKFFVRKSTPGRFMNVLSGRNETALTNKNFFFRDKKDKTDDYQKSADEILLSKYTPAGVVVNSQFDIVQFRGSTGAYLEASPGKASLDVLKMAREGLGFEIRNGLQKAKSTGEPFVKHGLPIQKGKKVISIEVIPLLDTIDLHYLILFRDQTPENSIDEEESENGIKPQGAKQREKSKKDLKSVRIDQLEKELAQARKDMLRITEEQEAANEELQSSNEELLSGSEELQSLNEELETSKEELQSTNEELITINQELYDRIDQLNKARKFSDSIISVLHEPLLVLDRSFIIKRANEAFYKTFRLSESQTLGKILFELQDNTWAI